MATSIMGIMLPLSVIFTLFSAAFNASSTILQRQATGTQEKHILYSRNFFTQVTRHPLFLIGTVLQLLAAAFHLLALSQGSLIIVQPLLTLDLVFLVLFMHFRYKLKTGKQEWIPVAAIVLGLCAFFIVSHPESGHAPYVSLKWVLTIIFGALAIGICMVIAKISDSAKVRAVFSALATAICYGLNSGFAKLVVTQLKSHGLFPLFIHWPIYALIVSAIFSVVLMQNAYASGPLVTSQPILETVGPLFSSFIAIILFGDFVRHSPVAIAGEVLSSAVLIWGIFKLGGSNKLYIKHKPRH